MGTFPRQVWGLLEGTLGEEDRAGLAIRVAELWEALLAFLCKGSQGRRRASETSGEQLNTQRGPRETCARLPYACRWLDVFLWTCPVDEGLLCHPGEG